MMRRMMALVLAGLALLVGSAPAPVLALGKKTVMVPMSDGVKLATDVYLPDGTGQFPVVLARTPYGRTTDFTGAVACMLGYVGVVQDMRGRFGSEGENLPFIGCGWEAPHDGADTVAWILTQDWCNGKVGTFGGSAGGITQNLLAGAQPQGVQAQYIAVAAANLYTDAGYIGGAFRKEQVEGWTTSHHFDPKAILMWKEHPSFDAFWQRFDSTAKHAVMTSPAVHVGGWFDTFSQGTIDSFVGRQYHGAEGAKGKQKLVMGPWTHGGLGGGKPGELKFRDSRPRMQYDMFRWFDCLLKGQDNGILKEPAVAYYVMGDVDDPQAPGNKWRYADAWPPPSTETPYYFGKGGTLGEAKPAAGPAFVEYTFDPADPCPTLGGRNLNIKAGPMDQRPAEARKDVLSFTTEPLAAPLEVTGRLRAKVWVSASTADTDLSVRFADVYPDGRSMLMSEGMLRLRYRKSLSAPEPMKPGEPCEVDVDCWSTSLVVAKGHRIRVAVTSSNYPRFDLNPGTGKPWTDDAAAVKQTNRIYVDAAHPSRIVLPVVKVGGEAK